MSSWRVAAVLAALLGAGVGGFYVLTEPAERSVTTLATGEARRNPLLAAERLLRSLGASVESRAHLTPLPPPDHVLVLGQEQRFVSRVLAAELMDWITRGGHLILGPTVTVTARQTTEASDHDPLFELLALAATEIDSAGRDATSEWEIQVREAGPPRSVRQLSPIALSYSGLSLPHLSQYHGTGRVDAVSDVRFMHNHRIGELDHALLLWDLVQAHDPSAPILLIYGAEHRNFLSILLRSAPFACLAAAVWVLAFAWRHSRRFGPILRDQDPHTRSLMEHVRAAGAFFWRVRRDDVILASARSAALRRACARRARFADAGRAEQVQILARATRIPGDEIYAALHRESGHQRDVFTRWMRTLETVRRAL